jgi:hypothetical protein
MRRLSVGLTAAVLAASLSLSTGAGAAWFEQHACAMPARASCGGCAVSCPGGGTAVCRAGMSIWRGTGWSCSFQPVCLCQRSLWEIWP